MANSILTPSAVARDAAIALNDRLIVGNLVNRDVEQEFANKVGDTVKVTSPPAVTEADEFDGTTSTTDVEQREADVVLQKHFYKRADLTSKEMTLNIDDFTRTVVVPYVSGISQSINKYFLRKMAGGFRRNVAGTIASRPSEAADILAAQKALTDAYMPRAGRIGLIDSTVEASFWGLDSFKNNQYAVNAAEQSSELQMAKVLGATWVVDPSAAEFERGDIAGTVLANGTAEGTSIVASAFTSATGTVYEGTSFTIAGETTRFTVTEDAKISGNSATLKIYPALPSGFSPSDAEITFEAAGYQNMIYLPGGVAGAIIAPTPLSGGNSAVAVYNGLSVRVSFDSSITTLSNGVVIDVFCGARVTQPNAGVVFGS